MDAEHSACELRMVYDRIAYHEEGLAHEVRCHLLSLTCENRFDIATTLVLAALRSGREVHLRNAWADLRLFPQVKRGYWVLKTHVSRMTFRGAHNGFEVVTSEYPRKRPDYKGWYLKSNSKAWVEHAFDGDDDRWINHWPDDDYKEVERMLRKICRAHTWNDVDAYWPKNSSVQDLFRAAVHIIVANYLTDYDHLFIMVKSV